MLMNLPSDVAAESIGSCCYLLKKYYSFVFLKLSLGLQSSRIQTLMHETSMLPLFVAVREESQASVPAHPTRGWSSDSG